MLAGTGGTTGTTISSATNLQVTAGQKEESAIAIEDEVQVLEERVRMAFCKGMRSQMISWYDGRQQHTTQCSNILAATGDTARNAKQDTTTSLALHKGADRRSY